MEFQKYNVKEKKKRKKERKKSHKNHKKKNIGTKLITNTKKKRLKIWSRGWIFKNSILKKNKKVTKIIK